MNVSDSSGSAPTPPRRPIRGSAEDIKPPKPIDDANESKKYLRIFLVGGAVGMLLGFGFSFLLPAQSAAPETAAEIGGTYSHSVIVTVREGDTLDSIVGTSFPNFLVEGEDDKTVERFRVEWRRLIALRSAIAGGNFAAGQKVAIPALPDDPGAVDSDKLEEVTAIPTVRYEPTTTVADGG